MPRIRALQTAFTGGELDPVLFGRLDLETYYTGAAKLENVLILPQGGVKRRPGLRYVAATHGHNPARLIGFNDNDNADYLLVVTAGRIDIYNAANDTLAHTLTGGVVAGITEAMLDALNYTQNADTLILVHEDLQPIQITRSSGSWVVSAISFANIPSHNFGSGAEAIISSTRGWPRSVTFFDGRLVLGGLKSRPQTLLMSKVADPYNLDTGTGLDDEAINITIDDDRANAIRNVFPGRNLQVFTSGGEFFVQGGSDGLITPATISLPKATLHGTAAVRPVSVDGATLFLEENGKVLREFLYSDIERTYSAGNASILSGHLLNSPVDMALRRSTALDSANYVYVVNADGTLAVLNTLRNQNLRAWSSHSTQGSFERVAVVNSRVYVVVKRTLNSTEVRHVERFDEAAYLDASVQQTASPATTGWSGLSHLNGETVQLRGDGYVLADAPVSSGSLSSAEAVSTLEAGLGFTFTVTTLPIDLTTGAGIRSGEYKRLVATNLRLHDSQDVVVRAGTQTYRPAFRAFGSSVLDAPVASFTGWKKITLGGYSRDAQLTITQEEPLAFHLMALTVEITVN